MTVTTLNKRGGRKKAGSSFAPLSNMLRVEEAMLRSIGRPGHLPGLIGVHGPAGYGKTWSAAYIAAQYDAVYIELADYHSQTAFLDCFLERLGLPATGRTIGAKAEKAVRHLIEHPRPVIIDEVDVAIRLNSTSARECARLQAWCVKAKHRKSATARRPDTGLSALTNMIRRAARSRRA